MKQFVIESGFGYELTFEYDNGIKTVIPARNNIGTYEGAEFSGNSMKLMEESNRKNVKVSVRVVEFN
jgi:hypothetical protein